MPFPLLPVAIGGSALLNFLGAQSQAGSRNKLQRQLMDLLSPERLGEETNSLFSMLKQSPMYSGLRRNAMVGASSLANNLQTSFAQRGLSRSGIAGLAMPIARSSFQGKFADIDMNMFAQALQAARANLSSRADVLRDTSGPGVGALTAGGTLESIMPLIYAMLNKSKGT